MLMVANYAVTQVFFREPPSITIPYTFFKQQVEAGNVEDVTSVGDAIQGTFKTTVTYPPPTSQAQTANAPAPPSAGQPKARTSMQFTTQRPAFAGQDHADRLLAEHRGLLEALAQALLKAESLNAKEIRDVTGLTEPPGQEQDTVPIAKRAGGRKTR